MGRSGADPEALGVDGLVEKGGPPGCLPHRVDLHLPPRADGAGDGHTQGSPPQHQPLPQPIDERPLHDGTVEQAEIGLGDDGDSQVGAGGLEGLRHGRIGRPQGVEVVGHSRLPLTDILRGEPASEWLQAEDPSVGGGQPLVRDRHLLSDAGEVGQGQLDDVVGGGRSEGSHIPTVFDARRD